MAMFVVETQQADYLFACPQAAKAFARAEEAHWQDMVEGIGPLFIRPVALGPQHRFSPAHANTPLEAGPGQEACKRVKRHVKRWWRERDAWWNAEL
jgi:hypothetical protein